MCGDGLIKPNEGHSLSSLSLAALNARPYILCVGGEDAQGDIYRACVRFSGGEGVLNQAKH